MYTPNSQYRIDMAKAHRQREIQAAEDYRLAREARTKSDGRSSGVAHHVTVVAHSAAAWLLRHAKVHARHA
jgi:hypothetical protein